jgi:hypothetical protein
VQLVFFSNGLRRPRALVGEADEFLRPVLASGLLSNVPIKARMCAQTLGKLL